MTKKSMLLVLSRLPVPNTSGDTVKYYNLLKIFSKNYDVSLVVLSNFPPSLEAVNFLNLHCKSYRVFLKKKWKNYFNLPKALFNGRPLQVQYYYFSDVQKEIIRLSKDVDFVFSCLIRTSLYIEHLHLPKFCEFADSIADNYKRSARNTRSLFWKMIYLFEAHRLQLFEHRTVNILNRSIFVNPTEIKQFPSQKTLLLQNGVDSEYLQNCSFFTKEKKVSFLGSMNYQPNIDACLWFIDKCLPLIPEYIYFEIVGANPSKELLNIASKNKRVIVTGFVSNPWERLICSLAVVAPMQTGAGIQNKVLQSLALSQIVLATTLATSPIVDAKHETNLFICDLPQDYAQTIRMIADAPDAFRHVGKNARDLILKNYTWEKYEEKLILQIENDLNSWNSLQDKRVI